MSERVTVLLFVCYLSACAQAHGVPPQCASQAGEERAVCLHVAAGRLRVHADQLRREGFPVESARLVATANALDEEVTSVLVP
jgi:2-methylaconitate cis-trans-isomerase PrpF